MQKSILLFLFLIVTASAFAQNYYYQYVPGVEDYLAPTLSGGTTIISGANDSAFSKVQQLPFDWQYYGKTVRYYKVSSNGFLTFDTTLAFNNPNNTALPAAPAPNNAIYAFWDQLKMTSIHRVRVQTFGSAPQRRQLIQWYVTSTKSTGQYDYIFFAVVIYEGGDFDIVHQQKYMWQTKLDATVGCENEDGTLGAMLEGSPNFNFEAYDFVKDWAFTYKFKYGTRPKSDVNICKITIPEILTVAKPADLTGVFVNNGTDAITKLQLGYLLNGKDQGSFTLDNLNIPPNNSTNTNVFVIPQKWTPATVNTFETCKIWVEQINGNKDEVNANDTLSFSAFINSGISSPKKVLIEEFSTCPCGFCPDGLVVLDKIKAANPNIIGFIHHAGFGTDSMTIPSSVTIANKFTNGAPTAAIDRVMWPGQPRYALGRAIWDSVSKVSQKLQAPCRIDVKPQYHPSTGKLNIDIETEFIDYPLPAKLNLSVLVIEDSVSGTGSGWDQKNYYNTTSGHPMYGRGDPIIGYQHMHVIRALMPSTWGDSTVFPAIVKQGEKYSKQYVYDVPARQKPKDMSVIAFVSFAGNRIQILNTEHKDIEIITEVSDVRSGELSIYPNPAIDRATVILPDDEAQITIFNSLGEKVMELNAFVSLSHRADINLESLPEGVYLCQTRSGNAIRTAKFIIAR